jgi:hypothetical protein
MPVQDAQKKIVSEVSSWPGVSAEPHRFGGTEFRLGRREIGHIHGDYQADIPFPIDIRDQLLSERKAERHHILPESGWITFRFRKEQDVQNAIQLFRKSYEVARASLVSKKPMT